VWITEASQLSVVDGQAAALMRQVELTPVQLVDNHWVAEELWYEVDDVEQRGLEDMDAVFMRTDPPVTIPYLYATYILDYVDSTKPE
jgi:glutathione synthase